MSLIAKKCGCPDYLAVSGSFGNSQAPLSGVQGLWDVAPAF